MLSAQTTKSQLLNNAGQMLANAEHFLLETPKLTGCEQKSGPPP